MALSPILVSLFLAVLSFITIGNCAVTEDLVEYLPGLKPPPKFKHYSGYLKASAGRMLHYWLIETPKNPQAAPIALWMNGGPGCSSLGGLLTEHGPFLINSDGKRLRYNRYSWNLVANMLYLEAPAGVGFSYDPSGNYTTDDDQTSYDNYLALLDFFNKYPEYKTNEFFITGESYGGIYVPTLANRVMKNADINFKGIAVGNGLSSTKLNDNSIIYFGYFHGLFTKDLWEELNKVCCKNSNCNFHNNSDLACHSKVAEAVGLIYRSGINMYNLYADCSTGTKFGDVSKLNNGQVVYYDTSFLFSKNRYLAQERQNILLRYKNNLRVDPPCTNFTAGSMYLNSPLVRQELHIPDSVQQWDICSAKVGLGYHSTYDTMKAQYVNLLQAKKYRILIYNGDVDMACNFLGDQWFADELNLKEIKARKAWYFFDPIEENEQIAGFVRQFENLDVLTIKGAGHMVPQDKPNPAFVMFNKFIKGIPY